MKNEWENEGKEGIRLSHVFLIVLAIHLVVIGGAFAFQYWRGGLETNVAEVSEIPQKKKAKKKTEVSEPKVQEIVQQVTQPAPAEMISDNIAKQTPSLPAPVTEVKPAVNEIKSEVVASQAHTIGKGDTLSKIAKQYKITVADLKKWNQLTSDTIRLGQVLKVSEEKMTAPQQEISSPKIAMTPVTKPVVEAKTETQRVESYTVAKGDTLYRIAKKFGATPQLILEANQIKDANKIGIGMKLKIPVETEVSKTKTSQKLEASNLAMSGQ